MTRLTAILVLSLALGACSTGATEPAKEAEAPATDSEGRVVVTDDEGPPAFEVDVKDWEGPAGDDAQVVVTVKAADGFKINAKYPHKVKLDEPPEGLTLPAMVIAKKDAEVDGDKSITYTISAKAAKAGEYKLNGVVKLSVCNKEQCRMAKEKMTASVTAQ